MSAITAVRTRLYEDHPHQLLLEVENEVGEVGIGECWWGMANAAASTSGTNAGPGSGARPIENAVATLLTPRVVGRDSRLIAGLWYELADHFYRYGDGGVLPMALAGLDLALWDLRAKSLGVSVLDLLGGPVHARIPAYASLPPFHDIDQVLSEVDRAVEHGFRAVKLHEVDLDIIQAAREGTNSSIALMLDVNGHFDPVDAIALAQELGKLGYIWFEEPVHPMRDHRSIARVAAASPVPIAAGENEYSLVDFDRLLTTTGVTYLQPEITKVGGLTPALRIGALAELHNVALCPHNFRLGPSLLASIHWGFSSPATRWLEVAWVPEGIKFPSEVTVPQLKEGCISPPEGPGFRLG